MHWHEYDWHLKITASSSQHTQFPLTTAYLLNLVYDALLEVDLSTLVHPTQDLVDDVVSHLQLLQCALVDMSDRDVVDRPPDLRTEHVDDSEVCLIEERPLNYP